jgi:SAM-dependent methyltransferase
MPNFESKKRHWENIYSKGKEKLPWLENPMPEKIMEEFCSHLKPSDKVLDYGCGDGKLADFLQKKGLKVACSDISEKALSLVSEKMPNAETIQAEEPQKIGNSPTFDGVLAWGVMHHIDKELWGHYIDGFANIAKKDGYILIGGHSMKDKEFSQGSRISPTTGDISNAVDSLETMLPNHGLKIINSGYFNFEESSTKQQRCFKYFLVKKVEDSKLKTENSIKTTEDIKIFTQFGLDETNEFPHIHGNIPIKYMGNLADGKSMEMMWGLREGSHYPPEVHSHGHILTIQHGSGIISINGKEQPYVSGNTFDIAGNVPHGFIRVDKTTVVIQRQPNVEKNKYSL